MLYFNEQLINKMSRKNTEKGIINDSQNIRTIYRRKSKRAI